MIRSNDNINDIDDNNETSAIQQLKRLIIVAAAACMVINTKIMCEMNMKQPHIIFILVDDMVITQAKCETKKNCVIHVYFSF